MPGSPSGLARDSPSPGGGPPRWSGTETRTRSSSRHLAFGPLGAGPDDRRLVPAFPDIWPAVDGTRLVSLSALLEALQRGPGGRGLAGVAEAQQHLALGDLAQRLDRTL